VTWDWRACLEALGPALPRRPLTALDQGEEQKAPCIRASAGGDAIAVWIYINTAKEVGDVDHLKVFANEDAANAWFAEKRSGRCSVRISNIGMSQSWLGREKANLH
jgi:hypothetical protein